MYTFIGRLKPMLAGHRRGIVVWVLTRVLGELPPGRLHVPFGKLLVAKVLQHAPTAPTEEVSHVLEIHAKDPVLVLRDHPFIGPLMAIVSKPAPRFTTAST